MESFWLEVNDRGLRQGDYLTDCAVPVVGSSFPLADEEIVVDEFDLIILTQSCDLEQGKADLVAMSPIYSLSEFAANNPKFGQKNLKNELRKGRIEGLHLVTSPTEPENNEKALIVDFRQIYSLPLAYLINHANNSDPRWRLKSPYLEHFSQTFARFFMRVGLPSGIPEFK